MSSSMGFRLFDPGYNQPIKGTTNMKKSLVTVAAMIAISAGLAGCEYPELAQTRHAQGAAVAAATVSPSAAGVAASDPPPYIRRVAEAKVSPSAAGVAASDPPLIRRVASL